MIAKGPAIKPLLVYVVDDEPEVACAFSEILRHSGCQVKTFLNGGDLIDSSTDRAPDVVVTDYVMQPIDGLQVASWVRCTHPGARILMITADEQLVRRGKKGNLPFRVLEKPLSSSALIAAVHDSDLGGEKAAPPRDSPVANSI